MDTTKKLATYPMIIWGGLYYLLGCLSLTLDDPSNRISYIWLPAGVAVSAFLVTARVGWYRLFIFLFISRLLLDLSFLHPLLPSVAISVVSLGTDIGIAWSVRKYAKYNDELLRTATWVLATLILSTLSALVGVNILAMLEPTVAVSFKTFWIWWSANVTGTIFITPALLGLFWGDGKETGRTKLSVLLFACLTITLTSLMFLSKWEKQDGIALIYTLACLPMVLPIMAPVIFGNRVGAVCYILFSSIVMYSSWREIGPLFMKSLSTEESITLAQCYLSGVALLMVGIRIQNMLKAKNSDKTEYQKHSKNIAYTLNAVTGEITWNPHSSSELSERLVEIKSKDQLLLLLPYREEREKLILRWRNVLKNKQNNDGFRFRINLKNGEIILLEENNLICTVNQTGEFIIGFWEQIKKSDYYTSSRGEF